MVPYHESVYPRVKGAEGYIPNGTDFLVTTSWLVTGPHPDDLLLGNQYCNKARTCSIVGRVSDVELLIDHHGDFVPPGDFSEASVHFELEAPGPDYAVYNEDFKKVLPVLNMLGDTLRNKPITEGFIRRSTSGSNFKFSHKIFREQNDARKDTLNDARNWQVDDQFKEHLVPLYDCYKVNNLPTYYQDRLTDFWNQTSSLPGSLVWVEFDLKYDSTHGFLPKLLSLHILEDPPVM